MASDYYNPEDNDKYVEDGDTCYAEDLNKINNATNAGFEAVEVDVDDAMAVAVENSGLSERWAVNDQGDSVTDPPDPDEFSSKAHAIESKDWANASDGDFASGDTIHKADGTTVSEPSAETSADHAETKAGECSNDADDAAASAAAAAASAAEAIAANTISAGDNITIVKTGSDPYDYEVSATRPGGSAVLAHRASGQSLTFGVWHLIKYDVEDHDEEGDYAPVTGVFTAPETGYYVVDAHIEFNSADWNANDYCILSTFVDSSGPVATGVASFAPGGVILNSCSFSKTVYLTVGQTLDIRCFQTKGGTLTLGILGYANTLSIVRAV